MNFLFAHWHCILPILAVAGLILLQNRGKKRKKLWKR
jgi:hypothetical protein